MIIKQKLAGNIDFDYKWYDIYNCDDHDIRLLKDDFDLTSEIISYITDLHERPHFDHDYITNSDLLVYDVPVWPTADADHFTTLPIKFLMVGHTLFTVHSPDTTYMIEEFRQKPDEHIHSEKELIFAILFAVTKYFQRALSQLNSQRLVLDNHLSERIHNKDLQELSQVVQVIIQNVIRRFRYFFSNFAINLDHLRGLLNFNDNVITHFFFRCIHMKT